MIMERSFSDIICENTDIKMLQKNVFLTKDQNNPLIPCEDKNARSKLDFGAIARSFAGIYNGEYNENPDLANIPVEKTDRYGVWSDEPKPEVVELQAKAEVKDDINKENTTKERNEPILQEPPSPDVVPQSPNLPVMDQRPSEIASQKNAGPMPIETVNPRPVSEQKSPSNNQDNKGYDTAPNIALPQATGMPLSNEAILPETKEVPSIIPDKETSYSNEKQVQESPQNQPFPTEMNLYSDIASQPEYTEPSNQVEPVTQPNPIEAVPAEDPYEPSSIQKDLSLPKEPIGVENDKMNEQKTPEVSAPLTEAIPSTDATHSTPNIAQDDIDKMDNGLKQNIEAPTPTPPEIPIEQATSQNPY